MKIEIELEDLKRLYDLATDSPLMCSGSFETEDVRVLRRLGRRIGADLGPATPDEFVRDFPHAFTPDTIDRHRRSVPTALWTKLGGPFETNEQVIARIGALEPGCIAGSYNRRCGRDADHPLHQPDAPEPTSDPDAIGE